MFKAEHQRLDQQVFNYRNTPLTGVFFGLITARSGIEIIIDTSAERVKSESGENQRPGVQESSQDGNRIEVRDSIRIKRPWILGKDVPTLSPLWTRVEKIGWASFRTSDGRV